MRALILSCSTGGGHTSAAFAVAQEFQKYGHESDIIDMSTLNAPTASDISDDFYVFVVKHVPHIFGGVYYIARTISNSHVKSPVYLFNMSRCKRLEDFISANNYDIIITTHLYCGQKLTHLKRAGKLNIPFIFIFTDYTCAPFDEDVESDYFILPHKDCIPECIKRGINPDRIIPSGIPVQQGYAVSGDKLSARKQLKLPEKADIFLVMSGSMGYGNITDFVKELYSKCTVSEHIVVICGTDKNAYDKLGRMFSSVPNIHIKGFCTQVALYMDACDIIFTKPGGLSSTEAAAKRIPIVHVRGIPGCETANMQFFKNHGMSVTGRTSSEQIEAGIALMHDAGARERIIKAQKENIDPHSAHSVYEAALSLLKGSEKTND